VPIGVVLDFDPAAIGHQHRVVEAHPIQKGGERSQKAAANVDARLTDHLTNPGDIDFPEAVGTVN
jgi:hypothetical protein